MTMPLPFNRAEYTRILRDAGVTQDLAEAHADAMEAGLAQPVVLPSDLVLLKAEIIAAVDTRFMEFERRMDAKIDAKLDAKLRPIYFMCILSLVLHAVTLTKLFLM